MSDTFDILKSYSDWGTTWEYIESINGMLPCIVEGNDDVTYVFYIAKETSTVGGLVNSIYYIKSYDFGDTWEEPALVIADVDLSFLGATLLHDNVFVVVYGCTVDEEEKSMLIRSYDDCETWETPEEITFSTTTTTTI